MLRNFRQVFKGNQTPTAAIMLMVAASMLAYLAPSKGMPEAPDSVVARVYGRDILKRDLDEAIAAMTQRMGKQANLEMMLPFLQGQALRQLMNQKLGEELAERHGVVVTDVEVKERLVATLKRYPVFLQADGSLRPSTDVDKVLHENGLSLAQWERESRNSLVYQKLIRQAAALVPLDETNLALEHRLRNEKVAFDYVALSADPASVADPGDARLDAFLKAGGARFQTAPRRVLQIVALDQAGFGDLKVDEAALKTAYDAKKAGLTELKARHILFMAKTDAEVAAATQKAQDVLAKLKAGADFAKLADELTEDPSGKGHGGDLGWFKSGAMVKPFEDAAQALQPGQVSAPVKTSYGVHVIRLDDKKAKSFDEMKESLRAGLAHDRFVAKAKERLEQLRKRTGDHGDLAAAAKALGLKPLTTKPLLNEPDAVVEGVAVPGTLLNTAFGMKVGEVSKVTPAGDQFVLFRVVEEKPVGVPPLAEIRPKVLAAYRAEEARKQLLEKTTLALKGGDLKAAGPVAPQAAATLESLGELGKHPAIRKALLDTPADALTPLLWTPEGKLWVARVGSRSLDVPLDFEKRHDLVQKLQNAGAEKLLTAESQDLDAKGRLRPGLSSLWGRLGGIWLNPQAGNRKGMELE